MPIYFDIFFIFKLYNYLYAMEDIMAEINLLKMSSRNNEQYWIFNDDISNFSNILIITNSIDFSFEFIFYNGNPNLITFKCDNPFYNAFDKLLDFDNFLIIENDCETRKYDSKIIIKRIGEDIVLDTSYLNNNIFNLVMINNMYLKDRFNDFINELNLSFLENENKLELKKAE